ncbi:MAG TPA: hypothetical protein EYP17_07490 [Candidatus Latescibacteria bacterium]|nr:hypothetical protein [Candidatus Latescibacterota bacterium]
MSRIYRLGLYWLGLLSVAGCGALGYRYFPGPVQPVPEEAQEKGVVVMDDGTVKHSIGRLEIDIRPMTDEELNRQFPTATRKGVNPYTYGYWRPSGEEWTPSRFTVFRLKVKNYEFPKIEVDPLKAEIVASNGRRYRPFSILELENYFYRYAIGYAGNKYGEFRERMDILNSTLYEKVPIFSGQEREGYIVFPPLHPDVRDFTVYLREVVLRFDYRNEPLETVDLSFHFQREVYKAREPRIAGRVK